MTIFVILPESPPAGGDNISRFRVCCFSAGCGPDQPSPVGG
jgi:hypothetical protein